ncbi:MAG: FadR family transcriptional regulator [Oscillospiraceae bacterium]|nr:FadR family transcriptional regulator [Oscillospiraceae bacterium]
MQFEKIQNNGPKVPELVMDSLLKAMEAGTIRVGEELPPERDLAEALGISRNSLRECLAIMSFMGIVENRGNRKILVKNADRFRKARSLIDLSYSRDTFEDFMEFRRTNEREIARLACIRATEEDLERLRNSVERLEADATDFEADVDFHVNLAYASHNTIFAAMLNYVNSLILELRMRFFEREEYHGKTAEAHRRIYEAVKARDEELAVYEMGRHLKIIENYDDTSTKPAER